MLEIEFQVNLDNNKIILILKQNLNYYLFCLFFHFEPLFPNPILSSKEISIWVLIRAQNNLIVKNKFDDQIKKLNISIQLFKRK